MMNEDRPYDTPKDSYRWPAISLAVVFHIMLAVFIWQGTRSGPEKAEISSVNSPPVQAGGPPVKSTVNTNDNERNSWKDVAAQVPSQSFAQPPYEAAKAKSVTHTSKSVKQSSSSKNVKATKQAEDVRKESPARLPARQEKNSAIPKKTTSNATARIAVEKKHKLELDAAARKKLREEEMRRIINGLGT